MRNPAISLAVEPTASVIPDPIQAGLASGWKVLDASAFTENQTLEADVVIIGSGAGGGVTAEILTLAGLKVLIVEEGALKSSRDFKMRESDAYPALYQESAARKTKDKAINIMQGRTVGGSTTINWTSSFRTPNGTLAHWEKKHAVKDYGPEALAPWFLMMEERLNVSTWMVPPNENNDLLRRGAAKLGIPAAAIMRNVRGCWNLGYCGMGCPTNAKQSMLVTTIPAALAGGATLVTRAHAERLVFKGRDADTVDYLVCNALDASGLFQTGKTLTLRAKHFVVAGGGINSPALLLRSQAPDPHQLLGKRTFLHPVVISSALLEQEVNAYAGAPQTIYSDHFLETQPIDGAMGYKLEAPPMHPLIISSILSGFGTQHAMLMKQFSHMHSLLSLLRDGFHDQSKGGTVELRADGSPVLDYPFTDFFWDGARRALLSMAEIQFAAGAKTVYPIHEMATGYTSWPAAKQAILALPLKPLLTCVVSAHVMGGCAMSDDPRLGVVGGDGRYHGVTNLSLHDGSIFPTSIGANPQLSIYGIVARLASRLAEKMTGKPAPKPTAAT